jgi:UDP-galactopyranose mutase
MFDWIVVGAGFAGSVMAERIAKIRGERVLVIDRRSHIGGNAYDTYNDDGLLYHEYGPHIFHTNSEDILRYLSQFTDWRPYEHRVLASVDGKLLPIPINRTTINKLYGLSLSTDEETQNWLDARAEIVDPIVSSEDVVVSSVGRELYEKFFRGYTQKQWGVDPSLLDKSVCSRVPTRTNRDDRYFTDRFQVMPKQGYTRMFERMLSHPNIKILLKADFNSVRAMVPHSRVIFTGRIDEYFSYRYGHLPYRSLRFEHTTVNKEFEQPVAVINYPQDRPYTRTTEYKHLTGQIHPKTALTAEITCAEGEPYYPIPRPENRALYKLYESLAREQSNVWFVGRLATYQYYNMDQVVGQALSTFRRIQTTVPVVGDLVTQEALIA